MSFDLDDIDHTSEVEELLFQIMVELKVANFALCLMNDIDYDRLREDLEDI